MNGGGTTWDNFGKLICLFSLHFLFQINKVNGFEIHLVIHATTCMGIKYTCKYLICTLVFLPQNTGTLNVLNFSTPYIDIKWLKTPRN